MCCASTGQANFAALWSAVDQPALSSALICRFTLVLVSRRKSNSCLMPMTLCGARIGQGRLKIGRSTALSPETLMLESCCSAMTFTCLPIQTHSLGKERCPFVLEAEFPDRALSRRSPRRIALWRQRSVGRIELNIRTHGRPSRIVHQEAYLPTVTGTRDALDSPSASLPFPCLIRQQVLACYM
jgi:hypothetical protein